LYLGFDAFLSYDSSSLDELVYDELSELLELLTLLELPDKLDLLDELDIDIILIIE
jgi:hypothetical protein